VFSLKTARTAWVAASFLWTLFGCSGFSPMTCKEKQRQIKSDVTATFCIDMIDADGESIGGGWYDYDSQTTTQTFLEVAGNDLSRCSGASYDFVTTDATRLRITVDVRKADESVLSILDLKSQTEVEISFFYGHWTPTEASFTDDKGIVFGMNQRVDWLQVTRGQELEAYCNSCGSYGVHEIRFKTSDDPVGATLKPGEIGSVTYGGRRYTVVNVESTNMHEIVCEDASGVVKWALWRLPE
jgi:hypothetical protein